MHAAYLKEESKAAKEALAQILINSRMCAEGRRPIFQDTGIVTVFIKIGMNVHWNAALSVSEMINEGVRRAYRHPGNLLRASILEYPAGTRKKYWRQYASNYSYGSRLRRYRRYYCCG